MSSTLFVSLPSDVLDRIVLQTVVQPAPGRGLLHRLQTLSSLLVLCRVVHSNLSPLTNTYLYGQIFRMLFDITPIERRLGADASRSAVLTHELHRRFYMLKRIKAYLASTGQRHLFENITLDLSLLLLMLTESDGKNYEQIREVLGPSGVASLCRVLLLSPNITSMREERAMAIQSLALVILWINQDDVFESESPEKTEALLDILEPLAIQSQASNRANIRLHTLTRHLPGT
ncbi:hypothetical protein Clacol_000002 [Clathrus columnatus]|uniref:Uncharacterized protein n=1 Tax=Clathrus columnatus TaxID=1419009 RepID=A0AAV5A1Q1_9AGAM|nr:hypothetical protein Clacol_000002 [Clathrus columnatus]